MDKPQAAPMVPRGKFKPERKYLINPQPEVNGTLGLAVYFGTADPAGEPSMGLCPEGDYNPGFYVSREAARMLASLILLEYGSGDEVALAGGDE